MRRALGATLLAVALLAASPGAAIEPTCVEACEVAVGRCGQRCSAETSARYPDCELACARSYFVACFQRCVQTREVVVEDPFRDPGDPGEPGDRPEEPGGC